MAEERVQRRLAAILAADVVGYSRMMSSDEPGTLSRLRTLRSEVFDPRIEQFAGRIFKTTGDGALAEFASAVDAVQCSVAIQKELAQRNANAPEDQQMALRIGVSLGDVVVDGDDLYGNGVNVAARMEGLAEPGGICISGNVQEQIANTVNVALEDLGQQSVKNIDRPVKCFRVHLEAGRAATPQRVADRPAVVVLPFENMSGDPEQEYFADGLTEDLTTALSLWHSFPVIARNSAFTYKGQSPDVRKVGEELGARYVVEGSVRKVGNRVRITAQLIDSETGHHVWADRFDRELEDIFALQDEMTHRIGAIIEPAIANREQKRLSTSLPMDLNAWDLSIQGYSLLYKVTKENNELAREKFKQAIALDPNYARAWTGLAYTYGRDFRFNYKGDPDAAAKKALEAARRAVALDETDSDARLMFSRGLNMTGQVEQSLAEARRAVELNPQNSMASWNLGVFLYLRGRAEEGIPWIEKALEINPLDPQDYIVRTHLAVANLCLGNYDAAAELARAAMGHRPKYIDARVTLAVALGYLDQAEEARKVVGEFLNETQEYVDCHTHPLWQKNVQDTYRTGLRKAHLIE